MAQEKPHLEPYFGVNGGYDEFDRHVGPDTHVQGNTAGAIGGGFVGFNIPLGPLVVGAEANGARGFGDIRWEYGATGEVGFRAGKSGQIFARGGYEWIEGRIAVFRRTLLFVSARACYTASASKSAPRI